jgi:hypothetical protein
MPNFYDRVLIKLNRKYGKDELVASLSKKLNEFETENIKLKSDIQTLLNELNADDEKKEVIRLGRIEARKDELYLNKVEECKVLRKENRRLRENNKELITKLLSK